MKRLSLLLLANMFLGALVICGALSCSSNQPAPAHPRPSRAQSADPLLQHLKEYGEGTSSGLSKCQKVFPMSVFAPKIGQFARWRVDDIEAEATRIAGYKWQPATGASSRTVNLTLYTYPRNNRAVEEELNVCMAVIKSLTLKRGGEVHRIYRPVEAALPNSVIFAKGLRAHAMIREPHQELYSTFASLYLFAHEDCFIKVRVSNDRDQTEQAWAETNSFLLALEQARKSAVAN